MDMMQLFKTLYFAQTEDAVDKIINEHPAVFKDENWFPLGGNDNNFGVIENQQSSPIAALIEKITNSIDAVLMRKCLEAGIDPKSEQAPRSMEAAKAKFFENHSGWDLSSLRNQQAESIQIIADGPKRDTSLIIYDDGEGQHPADFEATFLSLLSGNKNEVHFVQGRYNMGGSGAIVFCGKKRYQLIGSKKYDDTGKFGFTLIREHPLSEAEERVKKNTWYEYLKINEKIPAFQTTQLNLDLHHRVFTAGTVIKMYSYDLPSGISDISRDLNQSINEYLFEPVLPVYTLEKEERYPKSSRKRGLYGLKRRLEQDESKYVETYFSEGFADELFGTMNVTCYVFKTKIDSRPVKETKDAIRREFFKNKMSVLFSVNGQVHGHYTSEFITRSLKLNLLKDHLLIHVDCTNMKYDFRKELFMASRDRLKDGEETRDLRKFLADKLGRKDGRLAEIQKRRKNAIAVESNDANDLLKSFARNLPQNKDLLKLLGQTLNLDQQLSHKHKRNSRKAASQKPKGKDSQPFNPQRFPTFFKRRVQGKAGKGVVAVPVGGEKRVLFDTDVENHYFDRVDEPGDLQIVLLDFKTNKSQGGTAAGKVNQIEDVFNVRRSSPQDGTIKIHLNPREEAQVGDEARIKVKLSHPGGEFEEMFWARISEPTGPEQLSQKTDKEEISNIALPELRLVHREGDLTWAEVEEATGTTMDFSTVMYPMVDGGKLEAIYINMDSTVLKNFKARTRNPNEEQLEIANRKYIAAVYFHTLFLYAITKAHKYKVVQEEDLDAEVDLSTYLQELFTTHYAEFLLNFGADEYMQLLAD